MNTKIASLLLVLALSLAGCGSNKLGADAGVDTTPEPVNSEMQQSTSRPATVTSRSVDSDASAYAYVDPYEEMLKIHTIFFDFDRSELRPEDQQVVAAHARFLKENPNTRMRLEGHADERGSREYNIGLGERRAQTVRRNLALQGAGSSQLATRSYGEEKPLDSGHSEMSWQLNRRVELVYY